MGVARFGDSCSKNPPSIAAFLSALMPNLTSFDRWDDTDHRWAQVESLLTAFTAVRSEGRVLESREFGRKDNVDGNDSDYSSVEGQPGAHGPTVDFGRGGAEEEAVGENAKEEAPENLATGRQARESLRKNKTMSHPTESQTRTC
ncbi:hypothetical protein BV22DRAFT_1126413 [Leucogyrophana mollusca]|uniref:Uncharacterized protein n=1 Tax=Leucogyrophana mollusca TaxID=85980 RepID=A0ACB8BVF8_9AGAM|nr:hypothetical protein BV22DRAFT_1126413 [Leucogyrophana mollusca]